MLKNQTLIKFLWHFTISLGLSLLVVSEIKPQLINSNLIYLLVGSNLLLSLFLKNNFYQKTSKLFIKLLFFVFALLLLHFFLNLVNVYEFVKQPQILNFCISNSQICSISSNVFYKLKLFRFITLSPNFFIILIFWISAIVSIRPILEKFNLRALLKLKGSQQIFIFLLSAQIIISGLQFLSQSYSTVLDTFISMRHPYEDRYLNKLGGNYGMGWIYVYSKFLRENIPPNAKVFLPPGTSSWRMEGNHLYMRYFLHPRDLLISEAIVMQPPENAEYILIAHGAWRGEKDHVWPKIEIPADKVEHIMLIDRDNLQTQTIENQAYVPNIDLEKEVWGLIKLKKQ